MRDEEIKTCPVIGRELGVDDAIVSQAYRCDMHLAALNRGQTLEPGVRRKMPPKQVAEIRRLTFEGKPRSRAIARKIGFTAWSVRGDRKRIAAERIDDSG